MAKIINDFLIANLKNTYFLFPFLPFKRARHSIPEERSGTRKQAFFSLPSVPPYGKEGWCALQVQEPGFIGIAWTWHGSALPSSLL